MCPDARCGRDSFSLRVNDHAGARAHRAIAYAIRHARYGGGTMRHDRFAVDARVTAVQRPLFDTAR